MHRSTAVTFLPGAVAALAAALAVLLVPSAPAGAVTSCVAWGAMPTRVTAGRITPTTLRITLRSTAACRGVTADAGATATLRGPDGRNYPILWSHLGGTDSVQFVASLNRPGRYRLINGHVQTYDAMYEHIPATWRTTSVYVRG